MPENAQNKPSAAIVFMLSQHLSTTRTAPAPNSQHGISGTPCMFATSGLLPLHVDMPIIACAVSETSILSTRMTCVPSLRSRRGLFLVIELVLRTQERTHWKAHSL